METKIWSVDKNVDNVQSYPQITEPAQLLQAGQVVAFPTETVYGLGANAKSDEAVKKVFEAKGRPSDNPLIVHIASEGQLEEIVEDIPDKARRLMDEFWPGPLTLILKHKPGKLSNLVTAGLNTVGIRMPDHQVALGIIRASNLPIAAPSANTSGKPSPTSAKHVEVDLFGRIAGIVDGGATGVGVESTVLDCTVEVPVILRPGGVTLEQLEAVVGEVQQDVALKNQETAPKAPGMKYTHYAPKAPLYVVKGHPAFLQRIADEQRSEGFKVGIMAAREHESEYSADHMVIPGSLADLHTVATGLYDALRQFDEVDVDIILSESFPESGIGAAVMNRLEKAAGHQIIDEKHV
ncbi:L-threonylcarbamoyladenylate synthase [Peribacillus sp. SI8-4]|uniref:L-threonylcarbamoyladenylate synthase n=1 Tax=Peribacillus sp. SI8-4 TaxID=3048009 RepID=UPI0025534836|nr:L-threonylcarbamoyladenylate synthase [Peribacillus sp. SI8-4]